MEPCGASAITWQVSSTSRVSALGCQLRGRSGRLEFSSPNGDLLDTLRRVKCFGVPLVRIDIRQESTRHTEALGELTRYLGNVSSIPAFSQVLINASCA